MIRLLIERTDGTQEWVTVSKGLSLGFIANSYGIGTKLLAVWQD